jgi:hypothetical protein
MAHVPDDPVARRVKDGMQGNGQLHDPQPGPQMPAGDGHGGNRLGPHLVGKLSQIAVAQRLHVGRQRHSVKQRRLGSVSHSAPPTGA